MLYLLVSGRDLFKQRNCTFNGLQVRRISRWDTSLKEFLFRLKVETHQSVRVIPPQCEREAFFDRARTEFARRVWMTTSILPSAVSVSAVSRPLIREPRYVSVGWWGTQGMTIAPAAPISTLEDGQSDLGIGDPQAGVAPRYFDDEIGGCRLLQRNEDASIGTRFCARRPDRPPPIGHECHYRGVCERRDFPGGIESPWPDGQDSTVRPHYVHAQASRTRDRRFRGPTAKEVIRRRPPLRFRPSYIAMGYPVVGSA